MVITQLKQLINLLEASSLESLTYKDSEFELELKKPTTQLKTVTNILEETLETTELPLKNQEGTPVCSPLVGVFYSKPSVDATPFVKKGDHVQEGDVLCILEAMKVMNEIKSPQTGVISEILVSDGDTVEYDQPLFRII